MVRAARRGPREKDNCRNSGFSAGDRSVCGGRKERNGEESDQLADLVVDDLIDAVDTDTID